MASPIGYLTSMEDPEYVETWLRFFAASARVKKLKDTKVNGGEKEVTDLFLVSVGSGSDKKSASWSIPKCWKI